MAVSINSYSNQLVARFLEEKQRLLKILPDSLPIEHIGSSAVGIGGKNIVDILVGVTSREQMKAIRDILIANGYFEGHDSRDDRIFLASRTGETSEGDFHIHICPTNEDSYKDFIILRDYLRGHPDIAKEYFKKKHEFAKAAGFDRKKYKALKTPYVSKLLAEAKRQTTS